VKPRKDPTGLQKERETSTSESRSIGREGEEAPQALASAALWSPACTSHCWTQLGATKPRSGGLRPGGHSISASHHQNNTEQCVHSREKAGDGLQDITSRLECCQSWSKDSRFRGPVYTLTAARGTRKPNFCSGIDTWNLSTKNSHPLNHLPSLQFKKLRPERGNTFRFKDKHLDRMSHSLQQVSKYLFVSQLLFF
jgi:hypothetical protein